MKTVVHFLIIAVVVLAACVAYAEDDFEPKSLEHYITEGVTIVLPSDWKPFSFVNESGESDGYLPQLWRAWGAKAELPYRLEFRTKAEALAMMKNKEADVIGGLYYSDAREDFLDFADSLYSATTVLAVMDGGAVDCSNAMVRHKVAIVADSRFEEAIAGKYPEAQPKAYPEATVGVNGFLDGETDAVAVEYTPLMKVARERGVVERLNICRTVYYDEVYAGVQEGEEELLALVNEGLAAIAPEEWTRIKERWFEKREQRRFSWELAATPAGITAFFVLGAVYLWMRRRRQRRERRG